MPDHDAVVYSKNNQKFINGQRNPFAALKCRPHPSNAHLAHLADSFDGFLKQARSPKSLSTERRKRRKLEQHGQLSFSVAQHQDDFERVLQTTFRQKSVSYRELGVTDLFADTTYREFVEHLSREHAVDGFIHLSWLEQNDRILATHWGLVHGKRFYYLLPTFERGPLARFSPGNIHLQHLLEWCIDNDLEVFDFTVGDEEYKLQWRDTQLNLLDHMQGVSIRGYLYVAFVSARNELKRRIKASSTLRRAFLSLRSFRARISTR